MLTRIPKGPPKGSTKRPHERIPWTIPTGNRLCGVGRGRGPGPAKDSPRNNSKPCKALPDSTKSCQNLSDPTKPHQTSPRDPPRPYFAIPVPTRAYQTLAGQTIPCQPYQTSQTLPDPVRPPQDRTKPSHLIILFRYYCVHSRSPHLAPPIRPHDK
jgi:hypothetical protein